MLSQRALGPSDLDQILNLLDAKPTTLHGYSNPEFHEHFKVNVKHWIHDPLFFSVGILDDDQLMAMAMATESKGSPSWAWVHWLSRPGFTAEIITRAFKSGDTSLRESLIQAEAILFDEMEVNRKLNRVFFMTAESADHRGRLTSNPDESNRKLQSLMNRLMHHNTRFKNYQVITECVVEPGTFPKYDYQKALLGHRVWPMRIHVRMGVKMDHLAAVPGVV